MKLTDQIRAQLIASGASRNKVHQATGITRATVAAFLDGKEVHSSTLDAIAEFLSASVTFPPLPKTRATRKGTAGDKKRSPSPRTSES